MAVVYKVLGQAAPNATTETALYTVPANTQAIVSSLVVCNRSAVAVTFRVSVDVAGGGTANKDYLYYDVSISGNNTFAAVLGLSLAATDVVNVYASTANLSFSAFGREQSA
jgi:hypothetical protein